MPSELNIVHLFGIFVALVITLKLVGGILFWVLSYILGNKLADVLQAE